jgi:general secretion pathway protein D
LHESVLVDVKHYVKLCLVVCLWLPMTLAQSSPAARELVQDAKRAEKKGDLFRAYSLYTQAAALEPDNPEYAGKSIGLRSKAMGSVQVVPKPEPAAEQKLPPDVLPYPELGVETLISPKDLEDVKRMLPPPELKPTSQRLSFELNASPRDLFDKVLKAFGYDLIFDSDYPEDTTPKRFHIVDQDYREAIHALEVLTGSFVTPMGEKLVLVAKDTQPKRQEQERTVAVMVDIPDPFQTQDAQELARAVQQVMELQKFAVDGTRRAAYMRGPVSKVRPALMLFHQLMSARAQVLVEVELFEVNKDTSTRWGLDLPSLFNLRNFTELISSGTGIPLSQAFRYLGATNYYGIGIGSAQLIASMTYNNAASLQKSEVRTMDQMPAQLHVGDKYPVQTAGFLNQGIGGFQAPPTVQFEDLGLTLKVTPRIHSMEEVSLDLEAEFKLLTGQALNGIPVIANRKYTGKVRLRSGEWAVVAGLVTDTQTTSLSGIPVLRDVPGLGVRTRERRHGDTLLVIRPRVLTLPASEIVPSPIWVGTEGRLRSPL